MAKKWRFCCLAIISLILSSDRMSGIRSQSAMTTDDAYNDETQSSAGEIQGTSPSNPPIPGAAATTAEDNGYCDDSYDCADPFTMSSESSLEASPASSCACRSSFMNTGKCCLSQWWIIGLALGAGAVVLLAFAVAVGCCCSYKGEAKRAKAETKTAQHLNRTLQDDLDRMESRVIESSANRDVAMATIRGHSEPKVTESSVHPSAAPAAAAAAAVNASSEHHISSDAHSGAHPPHPHPGVNHPDSTAAQDTRRHDNDGGGIGHSEQRSNTGQLHRQGGHGADGFHDLSSRRSPEPDYSRHYDDSHRSGGGAGSGSGFVDPYFGASRKNQMYDDNDSLEAYDDTAPATRNNYNYYRPPTTAYNNHHVINRPSFRY